MKHPIIFSFGMIAAMAISPTVWADEATEPVTTTETQPVYTISIGTEIMNGDTTYEIGYPVTTPDGIQYDGYFPFSKLEWPLDITLMRLDGNIALNDSWRINATIKKDLTDPDGNMADSDWITWSNPDQLDVYSESSITDFSALIFDINVEWDFFKKETYSFFTGLGYEYQNFDYVSNLLSQYSPSGQPGFDATLNGQVPSINYEISYHMPYVLIGYDYHIGDKVQFKTSFAFSPLVYAEDRDEHLLRENGGKISESSMNGTSVMLDVMGKYNFTEMVWLALGFNMKQIKVDGDQTQVYVNGGRLGTVAVESSSNQYSGYLNVGLDF